MLVRGNDGVLKMAQIVWKAQPTQGSTGGRAPPEVPSIQGVASVSGVAHLNCCCLRRLLREGALRVVRRTLSKVRWKHGYSLCVNS